ncbi:MAG: HEAT repeat domain-containing protein [Planctomycetota bacterium]
MTTAESAASRAADEIPELRAALQDPDTAVRYWAATGFLIRANDGKPAEDPTLIDALGDSSPYVRMTAAETLAMGTDRELQKRCGARSARIGQRSTE